MSRKYVDLQNLGADRQAVHAGHTLAELHMRVYEPECHILKQRYNSSIILAKTRYLMGKEGMNSITVKMIADACGLSVQTLYNLYANRKHIITVSIGDQINRMFRSARSDESYTNAIFAIADMDYTMYTDFPEFMKTAAAAYVSRDDEIHAFIRKTMIRNLSDMFGDFKKSGKIHQNISVNSLSRTINAAFCGLTTDFIKGYISLEEYRTDFLCATYRIMHSCLSLSELEKLDRWIHEERSETPRFGYRELRNAIQ